MSLCSRPEPSRHEVTFLLMALNECRQETVSGGAARSPSVPSHLGSKRAKAATADGSPHRHRFEENRTTQQTRSKAMLQDSQRGGIIPIYGERVRPVFTQSKEKSINK